MVADGGGGAIFGWWDGRHYGSSYDPYSSDLYGTHLNPQGHPAAPMWVQNGNPICDALGSQSDPMMVEDGVGGAVVLWHDDRGYYMQRINDLDNSEDLSATALSTRSSLPMQVRPNPFNPSTVASFELRVTSHVSLRIYDTAGRLVTTLVNGWREAGSHQVTWDASGLPSGLYFCRMQAGDFRAVQKMMLVK